MISLTIPASKHFEILLSNVDVHISFLIFLPPPLLPVLVSLPQTHTHKHVHTLPPLLTHSLSPLRSHRYVTTLVETIQYYSGHFHQQEEQLARHVQSWALQCDERIKHSLDKLHTVKKAVAQRHTGTKAGGEVSTVSCITCSIATLHRLMSCHVLSWTIYMPYPAIMFTKHHLSCMALINALMQLD